MQLQGMLFKITLAKVIEEVSMKDTTDPMTEFQVQIYCPSDMHDFCKPGNNMYPA